MLGRLRVFRSLLLLSFAAASLPHALPAQTSYITGTVTDAAASVPLPGVRVELRSTAGLIVSTVNTNDAGQYRISNVSPGSYSLYFTRIGYIPAREDGVNVSAGIPVIRGAALARAVFQLNPTVISISRTQEKALDAPASVTVVDPRQIEERPSLTVADHMRGVTGMDVTTGGLLQSNMVARGFNNAFSGALLTLIDNRFASVPSLRVNVPALMSTTNSDIDRVEAVLGPAAALYGPNSANGVLAIFTKSPFVSRGAMLTLEGGERSVLKGSLRAAAVLGDKLGVKLSAERMTGEDFPYVDPGEPAVILRPENPGDQRTPVTYSRNFSVERTAMEFRTDYRLTADTELIGSYGLTNLGRAIEITGANGAAQAQDWNYQHIQLRARHKGLFAQFFTNFSDAGNADSLDNRGTFLLRTGNPIVDQSRVMALQAQQIWEPTSRQQLIFGADYVKTDPRTLGTINGRNENDDETTEYGFYAHSLTRLSPKVDLVAALRSDFQSVVDETNISPRVGLVYRPDDRNNWRLTFNRAFFTSANFAFFIDLPIQRVDPQLPYFARALGNRHGFVYRRDCSQGVQGLCMKSPFSATPTTYVNSSGTDLYRAGITVAGPLAEAALAAQLGNAEQAAQIMNYLRSLTPTTAQAQGQLAALVPGAGILPVTSEWNDIPKQTAESYNVVELGYKGIFGDKGRLAVDLWYQRRQNFTGPASNISPSVFIAAGPLVPYLTEQLTPLMGAQDAAAFAAQLGNGMALVPLGTVVPDHPLAANSDVLFSFFQVREDLDLYGTDIAVDYVLGSKWSAGGTYSWVSKDYFPEVFGGGVEPLALNAADNKGSLSLRYRDEDSGISGEVRGRYSNAFTVSSGVYQGRVPVNAVLDLFASYRVSSSVLLSISVSNALDNARPSFIGVPSIGRLTLGKVQYSFQ